MFETGKLCQDIHRGEKKSPGLDLVKVLNRRSEIPQPLRHLTRCADLPLHNSDAPTGNVHGRNIHPA